MTAFSSTVDTPIGPFTAIVDDDGAVLASGWTADVDALIPLIHAQLRNPGRPTARPELGPVTAAVRAYHDGDLTAPDAIPVRQHSGGTFLTTAWKVLRDVTPGVPVTYTELAARAGSPAAVRAAAQACARNAAALFVPCHRVIGTDGTMRGFRWGTDLKVWLVGHERH